MKQMMLHVERQAVGVRWRCGYMMMVREGGSGRHGGDKEIVDKTYYAVHPTIEAETEGFEVAKLNG